MNLQNYRPLGPKTTGEVTWRTRNPKRGNLQIQSPAEPQTFKTSRSGDQDLMAWWSGSAETTNPRQTCRVWLHIFSMPVCVCASILPVRWRTSPLARPGLASGVEPEQLWTGWRPAGSPCSRRYPSHAPWTHTEQEHGNTPTHSSTHTQHTHRNMWSTITMNVDGWSSCWRPVSLSLLSDSSDDEERLPPPPLCLSLSLSLCLFVSLPHRCHCRCWCFCCWSRWSLLGCCVIVCLFVWNVCVCERAWQISRLILPLSSPTRRKKERVGLPPLCLSLSQLQSLCSLLHPPSTLSLPPQTMNLLLPQAPPTNTHTHTCSAVSNLTLDQLCVFSLVYNKQDLLLNM